MTLNIANLQKTRDLIASQPPEALKMDSWFTSDDFDYVYGEDPQGFDELIGIRPPDFEHTCGTAACIGGWAVTQMARDLGVAVIPTDQGVGATAAKYLGLDSGQTDQLFHPKAFNLTQDEALATLDHLIATGDVQWSR